MRRLEGLRNVELEIIKSGLEKEAYRETYRFYISDWELDIYKLIMWEEWVLVKSCPQSKEAIFGAKEELWQFILEETRKWGETLESEKERVLEEVGQYLGLNYQNLLQLKYRTQGEKFFWVKKYLAKEARSCYNFMGRKDYQLHIYWLSGKRLAFLLNCPQRIAIVFGGQEETWRLVLEETRGWHESFGELRGKLIAEVAGFLGFTLERIMDMPQIGRKDKFSIMEHYIKKKIFPVSLERLGEKLNLESYWDWASLYGKMEAGELSMEELYSALIICSL